MFSKKLLAGFVLPVALLAQQQNLTKSKDPEPQPFFPKSSYFSYVFQKPKLDFNLQDPVKLQDYVVNGKLELSLRSFFDLVLANNTSIQISRLSIETSRNAITRSFSAFDPLATANFNATRRVQPTTDQLQGADVLSTLAQPLNLSYSQMLMNGTQFTVGYGGGKNTTNSQFTTFNPSYNSNMQFGLVQPLLRGRGAFINKLPVTIARSRLRQTEFDLRDSLIQILTAAEQVYWRGVELRESLRVQEKALELAEAFLKRSQRELELGAISRLDIYQPEFQYAQAQANVTQVRYQVLQQDDAIRRQIGADLDPNIRTLPMVLTEDAAPPANQATLDAEAAVQRALLARPDLRSALQQLDVDDLQIHQTANALRPDLSLTAGYTTQGIGGTNYIKDGTTVISTIPGGIGDALYQMFGFGFPVYQFGVRLRLPIRDRAAQANYADALVNKKRDALTVRNTQQQVRLDVLNAVNQVESSKQGVALAVKSREFAQKRLDAEQRKYELGTSQIFLVLQAQTDLINADSQVVRESVNYRRNMLNLLRMTGELLDERGVVID
jgi:outer membrane protein TolC